MWRYLGVAAAVHAVWIGLFLVLFTLTVPLDHPWWEEDVGAAVLVFGLCVQAFLLPVLGLAVMLWPERGRGLGPRASAHRVLDLVSGLEFRRRWPWTLSGALLAVLGWVWRRLWGDGAGVSVHPPHGHLVTGIRSSRGTLSRRTRDVWS